jgi:hypothetical protein
VDLTKTPPEMGGVLKATVTDLCVRQTESSPQAAPVDANTISTYRSSHIEQVSAEKDQWVGRRRNQVQI